MGRHASITFDDVANARHQLISGQRPHGIIAIRKAIGRGSPQLIARFVRQIEKQETADAPANHRSRLPDSV